MTGSARNSEETAVLPRPLDGRAPVLMISPHLDDAVLSAGATAASLADVERQVVVATVFAGIPELGLSPAARAFHQHCGLPDEAVQVRRAEDVRAVAEVGAEPVHLPFLDGLYRRWRGRWLCDRPGALYAPAAPLDPAVWSGVRARLDDLLSALQPALVLTCSAIGGHVDHRLVRSVTQAVCRTHQTRLLLWEDLPYALDTSPAGVPTILEGAPVQPSHIERKLRAVAHYASQLQMLGGPASPLSDRLLRHHRQRAVDGAPEPLRPG